MMKNGYIKLLFKAILFIFLFAVVDYSAGVFYRSLEMKALEKSPFGMTSEYTMWKVDADAVVIGASEASHSYVPELLEKELGMSFYNCGLDGMRFYYQNCMINGILDRYSPRIILWSIPPDFLSPPSSDDVGRLSRLNPFYATSKYAKEALATKSKYEEVKLLSQFYVFNSRLLPYIFKIVSKDYEYQKGAFNPRYGVMKADANTYYEWNQKTDEKVVKVFCETVKRCKKNNVRLMLIFTPMMRNETHSDLEPYLRLKSICSENNVVFIENLYHDEELMKRELFHDPAHFNYDGAIKYSHKLAIELLALLKQESIN